jgi:hypothetical protein
MGSMVSVPVPIKSNYNAASASKSDSATAATSTNTTSGAVVYGKPPTIIPTTPYKIILHIIRY